MESNATVEPATAGASKSGVGGTPSAEHRGDRAYPGDVRGHALRRVLAGADLLALLIAGGLVVAYRDLVLNRGPISNSEILLFGSFLVVWLLLASLRGLYHLPGRRLDHSVADEIAPIFIAVTVWSWLLLVARIVVLPVPSEVTPSMLLWALAVPSLLVTRAVARTAASRRSWFHQRVLLTGLTSDVERVARRIERHPEFGVEVADRVALNGEDPEETLQRLLRVAEECGAQRVMLAGAPRSLDSRGIIVRGLLERHLSVDLVSAEADAIPTDTALHYVEGLPLLSLPSVRSSRIRAAAKRAFDVLASALGLMLLAPLLLVAAVLIKLDSPGPIFFRQRRIGRGERQVPMLKLRTMYQGADELKEQVSELNIHGNGDGKMFKAKVDPRVTPVGRVLRRYSLDELPQLINVLRGEMSMVGPRPLIPDEAALVEGHYSERFTMRPGITGPWQTMGRSDIGFDDMVRLDYMYVQNWSLAEDIKLLIRTVGAVVRGSGAY